MKSVSSIVNNDGCVFAPRLPAVEGALLLTVAVQTVADGRDVGERQ